MYVKQHCMLNPAGQSMDHHFLTSYHHAIMSTVLAQFSNQGFLDGMEGIVKLVEASPYLQVLFFSMLWSMSLLLFNNSLSHKTISMGLSHVSMRFVYY